MKNKSTIFSRRIFVLLIAQLGFFFILVVRLFILQIKDQFYFERLSEKNRISFVPLIPKRGIIYDTFNKVLAENIFLWEALFIKSQINQSIELFINTLSSIIVLQDKDKARILKDYQNFPAHSPILIKQPLSQTEIAAIETFSYNITGVFIRPFYRRTYPYKEVMSHVLGYTSITDDMAKTNNVPNWHIGKSGIELAMDSFLLGEAGYSKYEIDAKGNVIKKLEQIPSKPGYNVSLTIDANLQSKIYKLLSAYNSASAVVTHIPTGNIIALTSYPSFDANDFTEGISSEVWESLVHNKKSPLANKPIQGLYPPGSTIKPIIALSALEKKIIKPSTVVECKGYIDIGKDRFHCWKHEGHGKVDVARALAESCDIFFYQLAESIKLADMDQVARDFGFGQKHLPIISTEYKGRTIYNSKADLRRHYTLGDRIVSIIGQGKWLTTPLQLNRMITLIANQGIDFRFNLLKYIEFDNKIIYPKSETDHRQVLNYNPKHMELVRKSLFNDVNTKAGTGLFAKTRIPTWELSGKTGTSQVRRITLEERETGVIANNLLPWEQRDHGLFVGFVPFENPQYSISVVIEHGGGSSLTAAPIARAIARELYKNNTNLQNANQPVTN
ncbi:Peptidoglycan D,D-transpeptidase MrdA [Candidatus Hepatincola sp. Av]